MSRLEIAEAIYRSAAFRHWLGIATPRDFEDILLLTMDTTISRSLWQRAYRLRRMMDRFKTSERTDIPEVIHG